MEVKKKKCKKLYRTNDLVFPENQLQGEKGVGIPQLLQNKRDLKDKRAKHDKQILFGT